LRLGAIDFVQKPVPFEHLKEILACLEPLVGDEEPAGAEHREIRPRAPSARPARRHPGWSLTSLQQRLFKTGGRLIRHARYFVLQLAESYLTGSLFRQILQRIERLAWHPT